MPLQLRPLVVASVVVDSAFDAAAAARSVRFAFLRRSAPSLSLLKQLRPFYCCLCGI